MPDNDVQSRQGGARVRLPPPVAFLAAIVVGWFLPGLEMQRHVAGGALLVAAGLVFGFLAVRLFRKTGQDPTPWKPTPALVFDGPFRYSRNPMYVGMTLITVGVALLAARAWIAVLGGAALAVVHFTAVLPEERYLMAKFGEQYVAYARKVRRYL